MCLRAAKSALFDRTFVLPKPMKPPFLSITFLVLSSFFVPMVKYAVYFSSSICIICLSFFFEAFSKFSTFLVNSSIFTFFFSNSAVKVWIWLSCSFIRCSKFSTKVCSCLFCFCNLLTLECTAASFSLSFASMSFMVAILVLILEAASLLTSPEVFAACATSE